MTIKKLLMTGCTSALDAPCALLRLPRLAMSAHLLIPIGQFRLIELQTLISWMKNRKVDGSKAV